MHPFEPIVVPGAVPINQEHPRLFRVKIPWTYLGCSCSGLAGACMRLARGAPGDPHFGPQTVCLSAIHLLGLWLPSLQLSLLGQNSYYHDERIDVKTPIIGSLPGVTPGRTGTWSGSVASSGMSC